MKSAKRGANGRRNPLPSKKPQDLPSEAATVEIRDDAASTDPSEHQEQRAPTGAQIDLLASLPNDQVDRPTNRGEETTVGDGGLSHLENPIGDEPITQVELTKIKSNYGIDQNARTRHNLNSPDSTQRYGINDNITTAVNRAAEEPVSPNESQKTTAEAEVSEDDALLRRATRMEELGFHVGIVPEQLRQNPDRVSAEEKEELLRTLGLLEKKAQDAQLLPARTRYQRVRPVARKSTSMQFLPVSIRH